MVDSPPPGAPPRPIEGYSAPTEPLGGVSTSAEDWVWDAEVGEWRPSDDPNWQWDAEADKWMYDNTNPDQPADMYNAVWVEEEGAWVRGPSGGPGDPNWGWDAEADKWVYDYTDPDHEPQGVSRSIGNSSVTSINFEWVWDEDLGMWRPPDDPNWEFNAARNQWSYDLTNPDQEPTIELSTWKAGAGNWAWSESAGAWVEVQPPDDSYGSGTGDQNWVWDDEADEYVYDYANPDQPPPGDDWYWNDHYGEWGTRSDAPADDANWGWDDEARDWVYDYTNEAQPPPGSVWVWNDDAGLWEQALEAVEAADGPPEALEDLRLLDPEKVRADASLLEVEDPTVEALRAERVVDAFREMGGGSLSVPQGPEPVPPTVGEPDDGRVDLGDDAVGLERPIDVSASGPVVEEDLTTVEAVDDGAVDFGVPVDAGVAGPTPVVSEDVAQIGADLSAVLDEVGEMASEAPGITRGPVKEVASLAEGPVVDLPAGIEVDDLDLSPVPTADEGATEVADKAGPSDYEARLGSLSPVADQPAFSDEPFVEAAPGLFSVDEPVVAETPDQPLGLPEVSEPFDVAADPGLDELDPDDAE